MPTVLTVKSQRKSVACKGTGAGDPCHVLGPYPGTAVAALADLGLTDPEIAGGFRSQPERITRLRVNTAPELQMVCKGSAGVTPVSDRD
ncbi:MAG: hypothetical protein Q7J57_08525 [Gemmobacter sp.]|nr:hypothetical protein [Gemmobacter sp.]